MCYYISVGEAEESEEAKKAKIHNERGAGGAHEKWRATPQRGSAQRERRLRVMEALSSVYLGGVCVSL